MTKQLSKKILKQTLNKTYKIMCYSITFFLVSVFLKPVFAVQIKQIYSASVPIASELPAERTDGFNRAFKSVIIKVSGQYDLITEGHALANMLPAEPYVQTFSYRDNPAYISYLEQSKIAKSETVLLETVPPETVQTIVSTGVTKISAESVDHLSSINDTPPPSPYLLDVSFAPSLIEGKLIESKIPIWGDIRPSVLLWVVLEKSGERAIVGSSDNNSLSKSLSVLIQERGVPLFLPVADLQDVNSLNMADLWGLFPEAVDVASKRYKPDAIVMLRMFQKDDSHWDANWMLQLKGATFNDSAYGVEQSNALASMVSFIAKNISSKYAINESTQNSSNFIEVSVKGIHTFEDYINLQRYLTDLPPVSAIEMKKVYLDTIDLELTLIGQYQQFFEYIELGSLLKRPPKKTSESSLEPSSELSLDPFDNLNTVEQFIWSPALN